MARDDVTLLPDGADFDNEPDIDDIDLDSLSVNFSTQEAESEARTFEVVPTGRYYTRITGITIKKCGPESKNPGKPFYALELTIQEGKFENQKLWTNVMLFEGALYTLAQLHKALDHPMNGKVITPRELETRELITVVQKIKDTYAAKRDGWSAGDGPHPMKAEVRGFAKYVPGGELATDGKKGSGSLLP